MVREQSGQPREREQDAAGSFLAGDHAAEMLGETQPINVFHQRPAAQCLLPLHTGATTNPRRLASAAPAVDSNMNDNNRNATATDCGLTDQTEIPAPAPKVPDRKRQEGDATTALNTVEQPAQPQKVEAGLVKLTKKEAEELTKQETILTKNQAGFWEMMGALKKIHEQQLYKGTHKTFRDYCLERWGFDRAHGKRCVDACVVYENLKSIQTGDILLPATEAQVRPLTRVSPDRQGEAWKKALELANGGRVTMKIVDTAVAEFLPQKPVEVIEPKNAEVATAAQTPDPVDNEPAEQAVDREKLRDLLKPLGELLAAHQDPAVTQILKELSVLAGLVAQAEEPKPTKGKSAGKKQKAQN